MHIAKRYIRFTWLLFVPLLMGADWSQFRGPGGNGVSSTTKVPTDWSDHFAWTADLPGRGPSSPITVGNQVIVTASSGPNQDQLHVLSFDAKSGGLNWHRKCWATGRTLCHPSSANAAPTPASDGQQIYAFYSSNDLICLDLQGNLKWFRGLGADYPKAGNDVGMSSSPVVAANTVVLQVEGQNDSFVVGIDTNNGETRWRLERPKESNWSSPVTMKSADGVDLVLLKGSDGLTARNIVTGDEVWSYKVAAGGIPSVLVQGNLVFLPSDELIVLDTAQIVDGQPEVKWASNRVRPGPASPLIAGQNVVALARNILTCADAESGELKWRHRLEGDFWASPVLAGNRIVCVNLAGQAHVIEFSDDTAETIATYEFGQTLQGTPALADDGVYVRSDAKLWKVAESQ
ncbi:MAG: PQQ-binding-like beta-propeller repeat protein [Planctomycetales bacterium]|nr:PQQ-binding-like beta-propeller repeat protein [Planctomycetales bacterium]